MSERSVSVGTPVVEGVLSASDVVATGATIAATQLDNGMIPWFEGGHCDPWNHIEAAMALSACGMWAEAEAAFDWLRHKQLADGSWFNYYLSNGVKDPRVDTNVCAYVATGVLHLYRVTCDREVLARYWPMVQAAIDFVLRFQRHDGAVAWSVDPSGRLESYALLTGSASIYHSLRCAVAIAEEMDQARPDWELAAGRLVHALVHHPDAFARKDEFAMDWYYPVLCGALGAGTARRRLLAGWERFVLAGRGVRCVAVEDWVTAAETAECVMALDAAGSKASALELFTAGQDLRLGDGSYWTGVVYPARVTFPHSEKTTYTAAAMVLAADALSGATGASGLFRGEGLPAAVELAEVNCALGASKCSARQGLAE
ncbi:MAG: prenyltransferase [Acidimicrobiales bacterium]